MAEKNTAGAGLSYNEMNMLAEKVAPGSDGLSILPFGNGAERVLGNKDTGASDYRIEFQHAYKCPHVQSCTGG